MKSLDLKSVNVQVMNEDELCQIDGGVHPIVWGLAVAIIDSLDDLYDGIVEGMNSYQSQVD